jgi:hypothetical protein
VKTGVQKCLKLWIPALVRLWRIHRNDEGTYMSPLLPALSTMHFATCPPQEKMELGVKKEGDSIGFYFVGPGTSRV